MKKYNFLNFMRLVFSIFVVANHLHPFLEFENSNSFFANLYNFLMPFAVPFFFLATGFFIGKKIENINNISNNESDMIKKNRNKLLKCYVLFTIIYLPITIFGFIQIYKYSLIESLIKFIRNFLFVGENYNSWILWYLLSGIYGLTFIYFYCKRKRTVKHLIDYGIILYVFGILIDYFLLGKFNSPIIILFQRLISLIIPNGRIFYSFIFIPLGISLSKKSLKFNRYVYFIAFILILILNSLCNILAIKKMSLLICSYILFYFVTKINLFSDRFGDYCKYISEKIYYWHLYFHTILSFVLIKIFGDVKFGLTYFLFILSTIIIIFTIKYYYKNKIKSNTR